MTDPALAEQLAASLPDIPRWVEARALLSGGRCEVLGLRQGPEPSFVILDPDGYGGVIVVGAPGDDAIVEAAARSSGFASLVAPMEQDSRIAALLPAWHRTRAVLHLLGDAPRLPAAAPEQVRMIDASSLRGWGVPDNLAEELETGAEGAPIAATFADGRPVSFAYAGAVTETLWDISIDTLPEHRRRGYAALCVSHLIRHMRSGGQQPVWASIPENPASWKLARKLGFVAVDEVALFEPPGA